MAIIQKIHRISDLPELTDVSKAKVLVAMNGQNYIISSELIKGKKITGISESTSTKDSGINIISIRFSDGTQSSLYVYNGSQGNKGKTGLTGEKGDTGEEATISESELRMKTRNENATIEKNVFKIVNDYIVSSEYAGPDQYSTKGWSAYRGKSANELLVEMNETFVSDAEYEILWNNVSYIEAEFTTTEDEEEVVIFANDTNSHKLFKKYWTYEEGDVATYFVAIYGEVQKVDEEGKPMVDGNGDPIMEVAIIRYDPVVANLWTDIYMGETSGYFEATGNQKNDIEPLYVYDSKEGEYVQITIDTRAEVEALDAEGNPIIEDDGSHRMKTNDNYKDKEFVYYSEWLKHYISAKYTNKTNIWTYDLALEDSARFQKPLYVEDDDPAHAQTIYDDDNNAIGTESPLVRVTDYSTVDMNGFTKYYSSDDKSSLIEDINDYMSVSVERCFIKDAETGKYTEIEYYTLSDEGKEACLQDLEDRNVEYIMVYIDKEDYKYTFEYHYNTEVRRQIVRNEYTEVYQNGNITLYSEFTKREYYTSEMVEKVDEVDADGKPIASHFETIYHIITIPSWIYAEFTTVEEDENIIVLNSIEELGEEDNVVIDITAEDYEEVEDIEIIPVKYLVYEGMQTIYAKTGNEIYNEVSRDRIDISGATTYYVITGSYREINGTTALSLPHDTAIYIKLDEDTYTFADNNAIEVDKTYYVWDETRTPIANIIDFISNQNITIFTGIPKKLPIKFMPENSTYKLATIEYDSDLVTMFEDGRICAIAEQLDENNETHTTLTITPKEGNKLVFNITILTPMASIAMKLGNNETTQKINIGETTQVTCVARPQTTSNKRVTFMHNDCITIANKTENPGEDNTTTATITGAKKGTTQVKAISLDGFGAESVCEIEVVKPVTSIKWNQDLVKDIKYTQPEINKMKQQWAIAHPGEQINNDDFPTTNTTKEMCMTLLKDVDYELEPLILPEDCSYPEMEWTSSNTDFVTITTGTKTIVDKPEMSHEATQEDIDNDVKVNSDHVVDPKGHLVEIGELVITQELETHTEPQYIINGKHITYVHDDDETGGYETEVSGSPRVSIYGELKEVFGLQTDKHRIESYVIVNQSVETIEINVDAISFNIGTSKKLTATLGPETAIRTFVWESSDESVVSIDSTGVATAINPGIAKIYAKATDGSGKVASCDVLVTVPTSNIDFTSGVNGIIYIGVGAENSKTIDVDIVYDGGANAAQETKLGVDWSSSDSSIVTVADAGANESGSNRHCTITGVSLGSATVIAKAKDNSGAIGAIQVMVINLVKSISFSGDLSDVTMDVNDALSLMPTFDPEDATNQVLSWTSSDESIASVNSSGIVTAIAPGEATITATTTDGSAKTAECHVTII